MEWLLLALLWPLMGAVVNIFEKVIRTNYLKDSLVISMMWGLSVFIILLLHPFINVVSLPFMSALAAIGVGALSLFAFIPYYYALSFEEISRVVPMWQVSSVFVVFGAALLLGETLTGPQYVALALIFTGTFLLALKRTNTFFRITPAVSFVMFGGFIYAIVHILLKFTIAANNPLAFTFWIYVGHLLAAVLLYMKRRVRRRVYLAFRRITLKGAVVVMLALTLGPVVTITLTLAMQGGTASVVNVIGNTKSFFVLLYSTLLSLWFPHVLKENIKPYVLYKKISAIALILAGVAILQFI
ncbi:DMT family transporter [Candidatus Woesearchaeota archaeon]|nr:DMT family transporter [Candidatus Woesearchaeota archaeon]